MATAELNNIAQLLEASLDARQNKQGAKIHYEGFLAPMFTIFF